ncbi:ATP-dependent Clp protease adaptor ClpS [Saccharicrinis fermentans]|uniref:ATP-dependent Clp protease adaptor protein ClpS n=1 Tax=Saccharicrinis fermentans DSM 9555 = JCM 21142 TaxID=869213 RepID=W7Y8P0_9BACT|nr:ATP-dependent Clp protease adaptor ClpS [Saccharicrinis fermentans]GAF04587.1 ATP-dependent Clp protease adaptor protein ClpS [Saccharicrinis fermentans DSM 9555 = JCM 21142]
MVAFSKKWKKDELDKSTGKQKMLILHNDSVNSFDYVIKTLCEVCDHDTIQAEQCAFLTHFKGQCEIAVGEVADLVPLKNKLLNKNLIVSIH